MAERGSYASLNYNTTAGVFSEDINISKKLIFEQARASVRIKNVAMVSSIIRCLNY